MRFSTVAAACRVSVARARTPQMAVCALLLWIASAAPGHAHPFTRLSGGVAVSCDESSAEFRVEVRNANTHPVILTHALFFFQTRVAGERFWRRASALNLLDTGDGKSFDRLLSPGEQKGSAAILDFAPTEDVTHVRGILLVHVLGEPFWRVAVDIDACD